MIQPLTAAIVRTHQAHSGPVEVTQELSQDSGLVGAARHSEEEGREPGMVRELWVLRSMAGLWKRMWVFISGQYILTQDPHMPSPACELVPLSLPFI